MGLDIGENPAVHIYLSIKMALLITSPETNCSMFVLNNIIILVII